MSNTGCNWQRLSAMINLHKSDNPTVFRSICHKVFVGEDCGIRWWVTLDILGASIGLFYPSSPSDIRWTLLRLSISLNPAWPESRGGFIRFQLFRILPQLNVPPSNPLVDVGSWTPSYETFHYCLPNYTKLETQHTVWGMTAHSMMYA